MATRLPVEGRGYYFTDEVAERVGISETTLREGIKDKDDAVMSLCPLKVRSTITWSKAAVDRWVAGERTTV